MICCNIARDVQLSTSINSPNVVARGAEAAFLSHLLGSQPGKRLKGSSVMKVSHIKLKITKVPAC